MLASGNNIQTCEFGFFTLLSSQFMCMSKLGPEDTLISGLKAMCYILISWCREDCTVGACDILQIQKCMV